MLSTAVSSLPVYRPLVPQYGAGKAGDHLFCRDYNAWRYLCGMWVVRANQERDILEPEALKHIMEVNCEED